MIQARKRKGKTKYRKLTRKQFRLAANRLLDVVKSVPNSILRYNYGAGNFSKNMSEKY